MHGASKNGVEKLTRRNVLHLAVASAAVCAVPGCASASPASFGDVSAGNASDLAVGEIKAVSGSPCFVARDSSGVYAMTTTCTHEGCDMSGGVQGQRVVCGCHGSMFDANGNVLAGPAQLPLQHFAVTIDSSGAITGHGGQEVAASVRA